MTRTLIIVGGWVAVGVLVVVLWLIESATEDERVCVCCGLAPPDLLAGMLCAWCLTRHDSALCVSCHDRHGSTVRIGVHDHVLCDRCAVRRRRGLVGAS